MSTDHHEKVKTIFLAACEAPESEREQLLAAACGNDAALRRDVESLIEHDQEDGDLLVTTDGQGSRPLANLAARALADARSEDDAAIPEQLGAYRILDVLGRGGMGVVYRAEQEHPRRTVALKVVRSGFITPRMLRRFDHETEALGRLQHPGIAQIFEAGTAQTPDGPVPFFAMELVDGLPLNIWAERHDLGTRRRLELISRVGDAVHHAHLKGVVHRDLKPSNILVDQTGQPKILDFGIARVTDVDVTATASITLGTDIGQIVGTLPYMSPEQVAGDPGQVEARSDVYGLGVIAYELLAGCLPYPVDKAPLLEAARVIREEEPRPLSAVQRVFRGDVETIVGKALAKEKDRRYESAATLAEDIRRYLRDEPIVARPPSAAYQLGKFARRNKAVVGGFIAVLITLAAGMIVSLIMWQGEKAAREEARRAQRAAEEVAGFLADTLRSSDPRRSGPEARVVDMINATSGSIDDSFADQPETAAFLHQTLGMAYYALGMYGSALPHLETATTTFASEFGEDSLQVIDARADLGATLVHLDAYTQGEAILRDVVSARRASLGPNASDTLQSELNLGLALFKQGRLGEAGLLLPRVRDALAANGDPMAQRARNYVAMVWAGLGQLDEAEAELRNLASELLLSDGPQHPDTLEARHNLAHVLVLRNEPGRALPLIEDTLLERRNVYGPEHPQTLVTRSLYGHALYRLARLSEAETEMRAVLDAQQRVEGVVARDTLTSLSNLATLLLDTGRWTEAEPMLAEAVRLVEHLLGPDHTDTLSTMCNLAQVRIRLELLEEAQPLVDALGERTAGLDPSLGRLRLLALSTAVALHKKRKNMDAAMLASSDLLDYARTHLTDQPDTWVIAINHGSLLRMAKRPAEAKEVLTDALDALEAWLEPDHQTLLAGRRHLALALSALGETAAALELLDHVEDARRRQLGEHALPTLMLGVDRAQCLLDADQLPAALEHGTSARDALAAAVGASHPEARRAEGLLARVREAQGAP